MSAILAAALLTQIAGAPPADAAKARMDAIWASVGNRLTQQQDIWFDQGDYPKAIQSLRFQAELFPNDYEVATNLGWMLDNVQDSEGAIAAYERYAERNPNEPDAVLPSAQRAYLKRDYQKALQIAAKAIDREGVHPNLFRIVAHSYDRTGRPEEALKVWDAYLKRFPNDLTGQANRRKVLAKIQKK